jgi:class 3 adenylate cyclase
MDELPSGTITCLFTDIEGSTQLLKRLGDRYRELLDDHDRILREVAGSHGGREMDNPGDAFFFVFERANAGLGAAVVAYSKHRLLWLGWSPDSRFIAAEADRRREILTIDTRSGKLTILHPFGQRTYATVSWWRTPSP